MPRPTMKADVIIHGQLHHPARHEARTRFRRFRRSLRSHPNSRLVIKLKLVLPERRPTLLKNGRKP